MTRADGICYPVALAAGIEPRTSNGTHLFGREIVVWRDSDGASHVWEDRCPHRGMRLSLGFVRGNQIACLYHGWHYDAAGQCRYIPAHPQLTPPDTIRVPAYDSAERLGMIFLWNGGSPRGALPAERAVTPVRSITVDCAAERAEACLQGPELAPFADADATPAVTALSPALFSVVSGGDEAIVGIQPLSADACALHIVVAGADDRGRALRKRVSLWAQDLRRKLEPSQPTLAEAAE